MSDGMRGFELVLCDATRSERFADVTDFVGEDASGSFGIRRGHARLVASLVFGLARFRGRDGVWRYLALPGALLYCCRDRVTLTTRRYLIDDDYLRISAALEQQLLSEEQTLHGIKASLHRMEEEMLKRLWTLERPG